MLNEITKGMDNAAEMINANFESGSVVASGSNENGEYMKLGNGWMVCMRVVDEHDFRNAATPYTMPQQFAGLTPFSAISFDATSSTSLMLAYNATTVGVPVSNNEWRVMTSQVYEINRRVVLIAIGRWE